MGSWGGHIWAQSHIGYKRKTNQDRFLVRRLDDGKGVLLAVADGMGGEAGGDIAAQMVIDDLEKTSIAYRASEHDLSRILAQSDEKIRKRAEKNPSLEGMGTTATVALVRQNTAYWSHVGDSRLYLFHTGSLEQISIDQTFLHDLVVDGTITQEEADRHPMRNVLDQCVGCGSLSVESGRCQVIEGDRVLLCSDGLFKYVPIDSIRTVLETGNARQAVEKLIDQALEAAGKDNITVVLIDI